MSDLSPQSAPKRTPIAAIYDYTAFAPKRNDFVVKTGLKCLGKCISQEVTMKDLVQCRKLEAKFRQLAVSDPTKRFIWLAEAEKWEHEAEAEIASHFEACNAVRTTGAIDQ